jgi:hypothetical protein
MHLKTTSNKQANKKEIKYKDDQNKLRKKQYELRIELESNHNYFLFFF